MLADASLARDPERIPSRVVVLSLSLLYCWRLGRVSLALGRSAETGDTLLYAHV